MQVALNPAQRQAVEHGEGPLLVLAGAGSGKTRVLTVRVARLIRERGVPPERILAVTFTNKAAGEMRERIAGLLEEPPRGLWAATFHSLAARLLRREAEFVPRDRNFTIYDRDDSLRAVKMAMEDADVDPDRWSPRSLLGRISDAKNALVGPDEYAEQSFDLLSRRVAEVYPLYERALRRANAFDFDDLLAHAVRLLEEVGEVRDRYAHRFLHVLVDEYQDTNHAQYRMVRSLARVHGNLCVVGDDDQSIYGWRGADLRNILDFERDFPGAEVVRLEENYRSTSSILDVANTVIAHNTARKPKELRTARGVGESVQVVRVADERSEARWTARRIDDLSRERPPGAFAVLYRTNAQSRPYEEALRREGIPYRVVGGVRFYERREIKDVLAYLQLVVNPADDAAFLRVVNWPRRGVGTVTLDRLSAAREADESLLEVARRAEEIEELPTGGARSLAAFAREILELHGEQRDAAAEAVVREVLDRFGVREALGDDEDGRDRIENVDELVAGVAEFDPDEADEVDAEPEEASELELFLQHVALLSDIDQHDEGAAVSLMTLHNAKGLEFPVVFIGGLERGLFPLSRAEESQQEYEEERRLFYVGVTRAMERLFLTHADRRWRAGSGSDMLPSPFLEELPEEPVERRRIGGAWAGNRSSDGSGSRRRDGRPTGVSDGSSGFSWRRGGSDGSGGGSAAVGLTYDYDDTQESLSLEPGARLVHPRFGEGTVRSVSGRGEAAKVTIEFDEIGRKKVVVAHADLRPA